VSALSEAEGIARALWKALYRRPGPRDGPSQRVNLKLPVTGEARLSVSACDFESTTLN